MAGMKNAMKSREEILAYLRASRERFAQLYSVRRIGIFGSAARGEAGEQSDVDVLIEMAEPTFDRYMDLKFEIESALGVEVDLVLAETVKERLKSVIEREVAYA
jgi:predicted nucleotidyltransferase